MAFLFRYSTLLEQARARGVVEQVSNLVDDHLLPVETADPQTLPYFKGDCWVQKSEPLIEVCPNILAIVTRKRLRGEGGGGS